MGQVLRLDTGYVPDARPVERPVSKKTIAEMFGVSTRTVDRWVRRDGLPPDDGYRVGAWVQVGAHRRFYPSKVREWLARRPSRPECD